MKQEQKIERIRAKCQKILELGKLRTQGRWDICTTRYQQPGYPYAVLHYADKPEGNDVISAHVRGESNAAFIASCAGTAEAMARSTLVALHRIIIMRDSMQVGVDRIELWDECNLLIDCILESWPDELL